MNKIYTVGYSGRTPEQLKQAAEKLDALVVDIRHARRSRIFEWNEDNLFRVLGAERYCPLPEWGNVNYKTGPIQLADAPRGLLKTLKFLETHNVILLCGCAEYSICHRRVCAELFHERGIPAQELSWPESSAVAGRVKALSLWQPWASLIAVGAKKIETRHWSTSHRGPLAIHAAKTRAGFESAVSIRSEYLQLCGYCYDAEMPTGVLLCVVDLVDCVSTENLVGKISEQERAFGNYQVGRFGWIMENVRVLPTPVAYRGRQGIFSVEISKQLIEWNR